MKLFKPLALLALLFLFSVLSACLPLARPINEDVYPGTAATALPAGSTLQPTLPCFSTYADPFAFSPDGTRLLVKAIGGVQIYNLQRMHEQQFITAPTSLDGPAVALSADGSRLAWALEGGTIEVLRLSDLKSTAVIRTQQPGMLMIKFSPDGDRLYSASQAGSLVAWGMDGRQMAKFKLAGELVSFSISPDSQTIATVPSDGPVTLWSAQELTRIRDLGGSGGMGTSEAVFSQDGKLLAANLASGLYLWKIDDGSELPGSRMAVNSTAVAYSPDGKYLAYASGSSVMLASPDGSQVIRTLQGHRSSVFQLLFSPDGSRLVSADDIDIRVWRVEDGQLLHIGNSICAYK